MDSEKIFLLPVTRSGLPEVFLCCQRIAVVLLHRCQNTQVALNSTIVVVSDVVLNHPNRILTFCKSSAIVSFSFEPLQNPSVGERRISRYALPSAYTPEEQAPPYQSGQMEVYSRSISKRGSASLRRTLFLLMGIYLQNAPADEPVYQFMDKKRSERKPYKVYMMASANKFLRIYYASVKAHLDALDES